MRSSQVEIVSAVAAARNDYLGRASWADAIERSADEDLRRHCITRRAPYARCGFFREPDRAQRI